MEKLTKTSFLKLDLAKERYIIISDIHGNLELLKKALAGVNLKKSDYLFLLGDLVEKGKENLKTLDYLMELKKNYNIYFLRGNCDQVFNFLLPPVDKEKFLFFALEKGNSVINEMALKLNITINENTDIDDLTKKMYSNFQKYYDFIDSFYDVILLDNKYLLVHGGLDDINDLPEYNDSLLKNDFYYLKAKKSPYIRIVGHNPTCNLLKTSESNKPIIDLDKNVIAIDGGNNVSLSGELNALIIEKDNISYKTFNLYLKKQALKDYSPLSTSKLHSNSYLAKLEYKGEIIGDYYLSYLENNRLYTHKNDVKIIDGKPFFYSATNNFISLKKNESFYLALRAWPYSIIIKDEEVGLVESDVIFDDL